MSDRAEALGVAAWDALQRLVRERLARKPGGHLIESRLESLDLELALPLNGGEGGPVQFSKRLLAAIDRQLDDAVQQAAAFRPGHTFCHRCKSVECEHSSPPTGRHVFAGYAPTGLPRWEDFAQLALERKHPRDDELYDDPPALLTVVQEKRELYGAMLDAFQDDTHELLGQLTVGFFAVRARAEEGRGVLAVTAQVAASRSRGGKLRLGLNLLGRTPSGEGLEQLWERLDELVWRKPIGWAQAALRTVAPGGAARHAHRRGEAERQAAIERRVRGILLGLERRLDREHRARSRRTRHAERRHASGDRPTRKAIDDARAVDGESLLVDERSGTLVVLGDRGRTHFFTAEGQHVSSVRYNREAIERKMKLEQWRPALREQLAAFVKAVGG